MWLSSLYRGAAKGSLTCLGLTASTWQWGNPAPLFSAPPSVRTTGDSWAPGLTSLAQRKYLKAFVVPYISLPQREGGRLRNSESLYAHQPCQRRRIL